MRSERTKRLLLGLSVAATVVVGSCGSEQAPSSSTATEHAPDADSDEGGEVESGAPEAGRRPRRGSGGGSTGVVSVVREGDGGSSTGIISGEAIFMGKAPERRVIAAVGNTKGCEAHAEPALNESVIVNDGKLQNVFVYIDKGLQDWTPTPVDPAPVLMDQRGCMYGPHVMGMRLGRPLQALNSDPITHNVHIIAQRNTNLNQTQAPGATPIAIEFEKAEVPVTFVCDIHPWMKAYVCVVDSPFFAVTDDQGRFEIADVPPGEYALKTWHEHRAFERQTADVVVSSNGEVSVQFSFED